MRGVLSRLVLGTIRYKVEQFGTEGRTLRVTNDATEISTDVPGTIQTVNEQTSNDAFHGRRFVVVLGMGHGCW